MADITGQAVIFAAPFLVRVQPEAIAAPGADHLLVQTIVSAISPGTEMLLYRGQMAAEMAVDDTIAALTGTFAYPLKYGYAAVGRVIAVGRHVSPEWQGRLVFAFQPHVSHFLALPTEVLPLPAGMSPETAVLLPNMETAVSFLMDGHPMIGEQVVVFGQGIVGLLTTSLLAQLPLATLVTVDPVPWRRVWSQQLGAHASLPPDEEGVRSRLLADSSSYAGADLVFELSGNPQALDQAIALTGYNGRILVGSWYGQKRANLALGDRFHRGHMQLISSQVSHIAPQWSGRWSKSRRLGVAWRMLAQLRPDRLITHRFPIQAAATAYELLDRHSEEAIQVVLLYE